VAIEQTSTRRRFTVVELPVVQIVTQSLLLPFTHLPALAKYIWIPFLVSLGAKAVNFVIVREDGPWYLSQILMVGAHFVLFTPFSVTWTKLAILGRDAISNDTPFAYSRKEWLYLLATTVMMTVILIFAGPPIAMFRYGQINFDREIVAVAGILLLAGLVLIVLGFVRLAFVFPAIAIGRYAGMPAAWRQTAGNLERLAAIILLSYAPLSSSAKSWRRVSDIIRQEL
jgi:hypothetical protein